MRCINVLLVEDDPGDVLMTREAFDEYLHNRLDVVTDGAAAMAYLRKEPPYEDTPRPGPHPARPQPAPPRRARGAAGDQGRPGPAAHPRVVLTTSQAEEDVLRSYQLHANAYVTKPVDFEGFIEAIKQIDHFFVSVVQLPSGRRSDGEAARTCDRIRSAVRRLVARDACPPPPTDTVETAAATAPTTPNPSASWG